MLRKRFVSLVVLFCVLSLVVACASFKKTLHVSKRQIAYCTIDVQTAYDNKTITEDQYRQAKGFLLQAADEWNNAKKLYEATGEEQSILGVIGFMDAAIAILPGEFQKYKIE